MSPAVRVEESVQIARSSAEVWEAIADYEIELRPKGGMRLLGPPPGAIVRSGLKKDLLKLKALLDDHRR